MRKPIFLSMLAAVVACGWSLVASAAPDLFISEYVEGTNYNRAIEIYNPTDATIELTGVYRILVFMNGSLIANPVIELIGNVTPGRARVIAHELSLLSSPPNQTTPSLDFNGDDAVALAKGPSNTILDVIGQIGYRPNEQWGTGNTSTQDNTLRRRATVCQGDAIGSDVFVPSAQWDGYPIDTEDGLRDHVGCQTVGVAGVPRGARLSLAIRGNPDVRGNSHIGFALPADSRVTVRIYDTGGSCVQTLLDDWMTAGTHEVTWDGDGKAAGVYLVEVVAGSARGSAKLAHIR